MTYIAQNNIKVSGVRIVKGQEVQVLRSISPSTLVKLYQVITTSTSFITPESHINKFFKAV